MNAFVIPALGVLAAFMGLTFLFGCFARVDSPSFIARAAGNEAKIAKLHSLQAAWDELGRLRQFIASSSGFLIMGAGLLLVWYDPLLATYWWVVPVLYAANLVALVRVRSYARLVLDQGSPGGTEVLTVIKQHIRMCISFSIVFVILVNTR